MPVHSNIYTDAQRGAVIQFGEQHGHLTAPQIVSAAAEGRLTFDGEPVPSFTIPASYVRSLRSRGKRQRDLQARRGIAALPPRDAVEHLRRELVTIAEAKISRMKRQVGSRKLAAVTATEIRDAARAVREIAAIPGPEGKAAAAPRPGHGPQADRVGGETKGPLAGAVHRAIGGQGYAVQSDALSADVYTAPAPAAGAASERAPALEDGADGEDPGSFARAAIDALAGPAHEPTT